jgi:hypothetical protein
MFLCFQVHFRTKQMKCFLAYVMLNIICFYVFMFSGMLHYHRSLDIFHRRLRQRKIPRCSLQEQSQSACRCLYESRNDQGMITLTGFDCATFDSLRDIFTPVFESYTPFVPSGILCFERTKEKNKGRLQMIRPEDGLGLVLAWTRTRGLLMVL